MDSNELLKNPEVVETTKAVDGIVALASTYKIVTAEHYTAGAADLQRVKAAQQRLEALRTSITKPMNAALDAVNAFFKAPALRLTTAEKQIKQAIADYNAQQERLRIAEQRRLDDIARNERLRKEAEAREAQRIADEKAAAERAEADRKRKEAEDAQRKEREAREAGDREAEAAAAAAAAAASAAAAAADRKADRVEARGADRVAAIQEQAQQVVAPVLQREAPKVSGVNTRKVAKYRVTNPALVPREYLMIDDKKLGGVVRSLKLDARIAGVEVWLEDQIAATAGSAA